MNASLNDSNRVPSRVRHWRSDWAITFRNTFSRNTARNTSRNTSRKSASSARLSLLCAVLATLALSTTIHPTACFAVDFIEIEFKSDSRSPAKARDLGVIALELSDEPIQLRPTAWYADKAKKKEKEKSKSSKWAPKPLASLGTNIALPEGDIPSGEDAVNDAYCGYHCDRGWSDLCYCFAATGLYYNPLYFEEANLERYGYGCTPCLQSAASAAHFFGHVPLLPYMMATDCPSDCIYALGHYRPGSCAPWRRHCLPINNRGGLGQAGAIVALVFLLP